MWRAERRTGVQYFEDWLASGAGDDTAEYVMHRPGWMLVRPSGWNAIAPVLTSAGRLARPYAAWAAEGRVLVFREIGAVTRDIGRAPDSRRARPLAAPESS